MGFTFAATVAVAIFLGLLLDKRLGSGPLFILVFLGVGLAAALRNLLRDIKKLDADDGNQ